jgi:predicted RNA-binding protein YlqC (UPF0109 family)
MTPMRRAPTTSQAYFGWFVAAPEAVETAARPLRRSKRREVVRTVVVLDLLAWLKDYLDAHRVPEQGDLLAWRRPTPRPRLPLARVERGGPDPLKPCEGCRERPTCRAPCQLLTRLLPPEEVRAYNEVSSPALMTGGGHDEAFFPMASALDWVLSVAKNLVQKPDDVQARWAEAERTVELRVAPEDRGKIIGRRGKTIDSLRIVANAAFGGGDDARIDIKLLEE